MSLHRNLRGFTRLDALVAGVTCLVLIVLVPALLAKPREQSSRRLCAANLAQIGKIMFLYAGDNEGALPRAGGPTTTWGALARWTGTTAHRAYGLDADGNGGKATISSSLYLLVKHYQTPPRLFLCPGDKGTREFKLSQSAVSASSGLSDVWDFGPSFISSQSCSFSYHYPFGTHALTTARDPNLAVAADRTPWVTSPAAAAGNIAYFKPDSMGYNGGTPETACAGNAIAHGRDGQNVLFLDGRVAFETRSYCGVDGDNIYLLSTSATGGGAPIGNMPTLVSAQPANEKDSVLVHDPYIASPGATSSGG